MDLAKLQHKIPQLTNLLPSQREWMERLLFQMTFNKPASINVIGAVSSGKSTLALAVAELLSDDYNVALLDAAKPDLAQTLMQQWFGAVLLADKSLREQLEQAATSQPLLLIVDNAEYLSEEMRQQLTGVAAVQLEFSSEQIAECELVLVLNRITNIDAAQLLKGKGINDLDIAQRLAEADGNIAELIKARPAPVSSAPTVGSTSVNPYITLGAGAVLILLAALFWFFNSAPDEAKGGGATLPAQPVAEIQQSTLSDIETEQNAETQDTAVVQEQAVLADEAMSQSTVAPEANGLTQSEETPVIEQSDIVVADAAEAVDEQFVRNEISGDDGLSESAPHLDVGKTHYDYDEATLLSYDKTHFAVQLAVLSSDDAYRRFKQSYPGVAVVTYQRNWQGKRQLVLLQADYPDKVTARATIKELPEALRATGPFIKSIQSVQTEIRFRPAGQEQQE